MCVYQNQRCKPWLAHMMAYSLRSAVLVETLFLRVRLSISQKDSLSDWLLPYIYQPCSRSRKVVDTFEQLLGGEELYHYHSKLMMKEVNFTQMMLIDM